MPCATVEEQRAYQREWIARRRADWLADKACVRCGSTEDLEVDHIDRATKVTHRVWSWSQVRRDAELAKCQVLCGPHHKEKTKADYGEMPCGTNSKYTNVRYKCRCAACRAAHAAMNKRYR
jgi:5-methylcytosine-specific restriction endonuclease McrA